MWPRSDLSWFAHDQPERPLWPGAQLCACSGCRLALVAAAVTNQQVAVLFRWLERRALMTPGQAATLVGQRGEWTDQIRDVTICQLISRRPPAPGRGPAVAPDGTAVTHPNQLHTNIVR